MPVPDIQEMYHDFGHCEFCDKCFQDDFFVCVLFDNEKSGCRKRTAHF